MPANSEAGATPAAGGATPPQTPSASGTDADTGKPATGDPDSDEKLGEGGKSALRAERQAASEWRAKAEKAERDLKALQDASLSEAEKRDRRLSELEAKESDWERERQDWQTREAVTVTALRLGFADPQDAYYLIDRAGIEFDETGKPRNVDKLLGTLLAAKPYLAGASRPGGSFDGGPRGVPASANDMNDLIRRAAGRS